MHFTNKVSSATHKDFATLESVFSFDNMYEAYIQCCKGVRWKTSTKNYIRKSIPTIAKTIIELKKETYNIGKPYCFTLRARGKVRDIEALHMKDRVVQKCYCDNYLVGLLKKHLIYDSGACLKGKGTQFTVNRLRAHLQKYYRQNKTNKGYALLIDYSNFFGSIVHKNLLEMARPIMKDDALYDLYAKFISNKSGIGLNLGSEVSQVSALFYIAGIDKMIKEQLKAKFYARYMDDSYIIHYDKNYLKACLQEIVAESKKIGLHINLRKTRICRIDKGFVFLNRHWLLTETNYIKIKPTRQSLYRLRRRANKLYKKASPEVIKSFEGSLNGYLKQFKGRLKDYVCNKDASAN